MVFVFLKKAYAMLFSRSIFLRKVNNRILELVLAAKGYGNHTDFYISGERYFVERCLKPIGALRCIDVGANVGRYSKLLCEVTSADVFSFEPNPEVCDILRSNMSEFSTRCEVFNLGLGAEVGSLTLNFDPLNTELASFREDLFPLDYVNNNSSVVVGVTTLDSFFDEQELDEVDLIKIDAEGFEAEIFDGGKRIFKNKLPKFVQIEMNWHQLVCNNSLFLFRGKA